MLLGLTVAEQHFSAVSVRQALREQRHAELWWAWSWKPQPKVERPDSW
jgi:hypothetical protein